MNNFDCKTIQVYASLADVHYLYIYIFIPSYEMLPIFPLSLDGVNFSLLSFKFYKCFKSVEGDIWIFFEKNIEFE